MHRFRFQRHHQFSTRIVAATGAMMSKRFESSAAASVAEGSAEIATQEPLTRDKVYDLWNEGNLFSLSRETLEAFIREHTPEKSSGSLGTPQPEDEQPIVAAADLIQKVEEILTKEPSTSAADLLMIDDSAASFAIKTQARPADLLDSEDVYAEWGAVPAPSWSGKRDFVQVTQQGLEGELLHVCAPRYYQLIHQGASSDVELKKFDPSKLPGCADVKEAYLPRYQDTDAANRIRFQKAFQYTVEQMWSLRHVGEIVVGGGKALLWDKVHKKNKSNAPVWTLQEQLHQLHPYTWFAIAHETNTGAVTQLVEKLGMTPTQEAETTYKCTIMRRNDQLDVELNKQLKAYAVNYPWDRFLISHYMRNSMPDIRFNMRSRAKLRQDVRDLYLGEDILKHHSDTVEPILPGRKGEVVYACERVGRKWGSKLKCGATIQLRETRRTPLIVLRDGEEGERLEYELIANLPTKTENIDLNAMSGEIWEVTKKFVEALEDGMQDFGAHPMAAADAFATVVTE